MKIEILTPNFIAAMYSKATLHLKETMMFPDEDNEIRAWEEGYAQGMVDVLKDIIEAWEREEAVL